MTTLAQINQFFADKGLNVKVEEISNRNGVRKFSAFLEYEGFVWKPTTDKEKASERMVGLLKYYINERTFKTQKAAAVYVYSLWEDSKI